MIDWETAYDNRRAVPGAERLPERWSAAARAFAEGLGERHARLAYGPGARQVLHLMRPEGPAAGLAVFVHGGYWMRNAPEMFLHLAAGPLARGWAVAMPGYTLAPEARIAEITGEVAAAVLCAAAAVPGPVRIAGHSAGGHLAARMACRGTLPGALAGRLAGVLSISGLHDLRPLLRTPMAPTLGLDAAEALAESPAFRAPLAGLPVAAVVGAQELPELRRQTRILAELWAGLGADVRAAELPGEEHFSVIEGLASPESQICAAWLGG